VALEASAPLLLDEVSCDGELTATFDGSDVEVRNTADGVGFRLPGAAVGDHQVDVFCDQVLAATVTVPVALVTDGDNGRTDRLNIGLFVLLVTGALWLFGGRTLPVLASRDD